MAGKAKVKRHPQTLTVAEVEALMVACGDRPAGVRNRALVVLMWRTALRCNEALMLRPFDLDPSSNEVRVMYGKGRRARTVGMEPRAFALVDDWLKVRTELGLDGAERLFCALHGGQLSSRYLRALLPELAVRAGVAKRVHPHGLRHTRAGELSREGKPLHVISLVLGHSNISTTDIYLAALHPREVVAAMLDSDWSRETGQ